MTSIGGFGSRLPPLQTAQALGSLGASAVGIGWTLSRWGLGPALDGLLPVLTLVAGFTAGAGAAVVAARARARWGRRAPQPPPATRPPRVNAPCGCRLLDWVGARLAALFWAAALAALAIAAFDLPGSAGIALAAILAAGITAAQLARR